MMIDCKGNEDINDSITVTRGIKIAKLLMSIFQ